MFLDAWDVPTLSHNSIFYTTFLAANNFERNRTSPTKLLPQNSKETLSAERMYFGLLGWSYLKYTKLVLCEQSQGVRHDNAERFQGNAPQAVRSQRNECAIKGYLSWGITKDLNK
jgi:hypothetical protein